MTQVCSPAMLATYKAPAHQQAIDAALAEIRADMAAGRRALFRPAPSPLPQSSNDPLDQRIAEELDLVGRQLEQLGGMLAADPILLHRHATQLQSIDLMQQVVGHLAKVVAAADKGAAIDRVTLTELKGRLRRKPLYAIGDRAA